ncbi:MAG TPA: carboxypeptidase regulatory-like domain-containing protein [Candidatus Solibacter sp.]|nr:carboxypeptidase regulatory-like domain-containing protein [Candidatus Solibacter sp.]
MKVFAQFGLGLMLLSSASPLLSESRSLTITAGQKQTLSLPTVFAGFSKDPSVARASVVDDTVTIEGIAQGDTEIILLFQGHGKEVIAVRCIAAGRQIIDKEEFTGRSTKEPALSELHAGATVEKKPSADNRTEPAIPINTPSGNAAAADSSSQPVAEKSSLESSLSSGEQRVAPENMHSSVITPTGEIVRLRELTQVILAVSQVSAAYSLDPLIAEAQIIDNRVSIWGRAPGQAVVVLVHSDFSTSSIQVAVNQSPPNLPEGSWNGLNSGRESKGYYEGRVSSNPLQISSVFDYHTGRMQLHFSNAVVPSGSLPGVSSTRFPFSYLRFTDDRWRLTLVDENVDSSPISVSSTMLRGIHFSTGGFSFHAGYTSVAGFQSLFLPAHKQLISGGTFVHPLSADSQVGVSGYYIQRDRFALDPQAAQGVGTLFFRKHTLQGTSLAAEVGLSRGIEAAASFEHATDADQLHMSARYRPRYYAASDIDNLNGLQSEGRWNHLWSSHLISDLSGSATHIFTRSGAQTIETGTGNLRYKASKEISLSSGISVSSFSDQHALFPDVRRFALPVSVSYDRPRFGVGAQYEYSRTSKAFSPGQAYRGSFRWSAGHFQMSANAGLDTQALGIDSVFSSFPDLNAELARLGLGTATNVDQLATLLKDRAFLNNLGIAPNATLQLVPRNLHGGLNMSWRSGRQILELDSNYNQNRFLTQKNTTVLQTVRYRRGLTSSTELITSFTMFETIAPARQVTPIWEVGLRHQFGDRPFTNFHQHDGTISGTVRLQDSSGTKLVRGAEITLDGDRKTTSDSQGNYHFSKVRQGAHNIQISFKSERPFYYSTPSKLSAVPDSIVDFGIIYPSAQVVGYVLNDAGIGLPDIGILVKGPQGELNLTTDQAGKIFVPVPQTGAYVFRVNAETVPDGYALEDLAPISISVGEGEFKKVSFNLPAIRALNGLVLAYDTAKGEYLPLAGATVEMAELKRKTTTDRDGRYSFRNVPSGTFTIRVNEQQYAQISLGAGPQLLRHNIKLGTGARAMAGR